jgi:tRNA threonylcarbamoyladenosine biosynthesis protein TsaB
VISDVTILALDTTSEFGSLAIRSNGRTVAEAPLYSLEGYAHLIFPALEQLLADSRLRFAEIDCFAAASGPGSFTGVRVGLSAIKGLAEAAGKFAVGISNLRAMASFGNFGLRAVVLDARRGDLFTAVYNASLQPVLPEAVGKLSDWLEKLQEPEYEFIAPSRPLLPLEGTRFAEMPFIEAPKNLASAIAYCAERETWLDAAAVDANYVRRSDAELFWQDN